MAENYLDKLRESARETGSIACMGLDPVVEALPNEFNLDVRSVPDFFGNLFREMKKQKVFPGAFKLNAGFYLKHDKPLMRDFTGSCALARTIELIRRMFPNIPLIFDPKRGDIKTSSANYATEGFDCWKADAITISPYFGTDSINPFTDYCNIEEGRGVYILNRTTNPGAKDLQNLVILKGDSERAIEERVRKYLESAQLVPPEDLYANLLARDDDNFVRRGVRTAIKDALKDSSTPLYMAVAAKIVEWAQGRKGVGAVVGATSLEELTNIARFFSGKDISLLMPGVGGQGGKADETRARLVDAGYDLEIVRINSSSGLTHPWKTRDKCPKDYAKVCVEQLAKLNDEIGYRAA